jgi:tRNA(Ile)-lysidine synthase
VTREQTEAACAAEGIEAWADPHNADPRFTRARVRHRVLPLLEEELGPGVAATLARTADQLRDDMALLDGFADDLLARVTGPQGLDVGLLAPQHPALRRRVLRAAALSAGAPPAELFHEHVLAVDALLTEWRGQGRVDLPGGAGVVRASGTLTVVPARRGGQHAPDDFEEFSS